MHYCQCWDEMSHFRPMETIYIDIYTMIYNKLINYFDLQFLIYCNLSFFFKQLITRVQFISLSGEHNEWGSWQFASPSSHNVRWSVVWHLAWNKLNHHPKKRAVFFRRKNHLVIPYFPSYDQVPVTEGSLKPCVRLCDKVQGLDDWGGYVLIRWTASSVVKRGRGAFNQLPVRSRVLLQNAGLSAPAA